MRLVPYTVVISLWIVSAAAGADGAWRWTATKAATTVRAQAVVRIPPELEASLAADLEEQVYRWLILEATASQQDIDEGTIGMTGGWAHNARYRLSTVLKQVRGGVPIAQATCTGVGKPHARRFGRFRCAVLSARLEIPSPRAVWENDRITGVRYDPPRLLGPFRARLDVSVTGRSSIAFQQPVESTPVE